MWFFVLCRNAAGLSSALAAGRLSALGFFPGKISFKSVEKTSRMNGETVGEYQYYNSCVCVCVFTDHWDICPSLPADKYLQQN